MAAFSLDDTGITVPRIADARTRVVELWRERFGASAATDTGTVDGEVIDILALLLALCWQGFAANSSNAYGRTAEGNFVDRILDMFARRRRLATASTASVVFYGTDTTAVGLASLVEVGGSEGARFATDAAAAIGDGDAAHVVRLNTVADSTLYTITVDGTPCTYTSDGTATREEIVAGLLADLDDEGFAALDGGTDADGRARIVIEDPGGLTVTAGANLTAYPAVRVAVTATETGPIAMLAGSPRMAVAISGVVDVASTADAVIGRNREGDGDFWSRHLAQLSSNGTRTSDALAARLAELAGVEGVAVYDNETPIVDADGMPPHSLEVVILGGVSDQIAALIYGHKPAGIRAFGRTEQLVQYTRNGDPVVIGITRPTERYLHLEVTVTPGEGWPSSGTPGPSIAAALATWLSGAGRPRQGQDFYRVSLSGVVTSTVTGVAAIVVRTDDTPAPGDVPTFTASDIVVARDEILRADSSRITVIIA